MTTTKTTITDATKTNKRARRQAKPKLTKEERRTKYTQIARERKMQQATRRRNSHTVCYHCRQRGHAVANCPHNNSNNNSTSTSTLPQPDQTRPCCYKCGSTQHGLSQCPQQKPTADNNNTKPNALFLPYATCFVCHQTGHLASTCPQNPHGIYVKGGGGCCKVCGSNQHVARHCPQKKSPQQPADNDKTRKNAKTSTADAKFLPHDNFNDLIDLDETNNSARPNKNDNDALPAKSKPRKVVQFLK